MVITWSNMIPRLYYSDLVDKPNTFQLVVAYDPSRYQTFVMFIYKDLGWDTDVTLRRSMMGYFSHKYTEEEQNDLPSSMKSTAFRLHTKRGNTGKYSICKGNSCTTPDNHWIRDSVRYANHC
ncbi:hypothetical protein NP493_563g01019 [Ridgeia piscesae]|uniref:NIDO domain-containing protein n=1 Tax=Ridgeia piscesae TaxID=27915 RepID=A0AAD9KVD8_RIDPI|nr:hypothetical protein NP493_563g01019 [Ridgeia piscesae]